MSMRIYGFKRKEDCRHLWIGAVRIRKNGLASKIWNKKKKCGVYYSEQRGSLKRLARLKVKKSERRYAKKQSMSSVFDFLTEPELE